MTCKNCWRKTLCEDKRELVLALIIFTWLVAIFNYVAVRPYDHERSSLEAIVYAQCALLGFIIVLCLAQICCKYSLLTGQYILGALFLTATIDGFIWKAIRANTKQDPEEAEHDKQFLGASQQNLANKE